MYCYYNRIIIGSRKRIDSGEILWNVAENVGVGISTVLVKMKSKFEEHTLKMSNK